MLHISADEQKERLLARLDDPTKHWKFNPADIDERAHWPALPRRVRDRAGAHQHRSGALVRRAERPQVVPQPGHRQRSCTRRSPAWTRSGRPPTSTSSEQKRRLVDEARSRDPHRRGHPLRHAAARGRQPARDRRGRRPRHLRLQVPRRRPGGARARGGGDRRGAGRSGSGCAHPGWSALDLDPAIARYEADEEVQDLLNASPGLNLGVDFLPGSFGFDGHVPLADGERAPTRCGCSGWTRSSPTSTGPGATPTCCCGTATCG